MARRLFLSILTLAASLLAVAVVYAQDGGTTYPTDDDVNRVAKQLYCPVCPNTPLDVCETKACQDWRAQIKDQLAQGWTDDQVIEYFVAQYGERVLAEPRRSGFTSFVWLLPVLSVAIGLVVVVQILRGWKTKRPAPVPAQSTLSPDLPPEVRERLERELREIA
ncbi:MAG: cytochrome c-type biogenesis protein CcmH [Chloroflexi bacterium]|nr:cytochrome c-type biogenesis protein CcmH [Chloroflexota bacterium]